MCFTSSVSHRCEKYAMYYNVPALCKIKAIILFEGFCCRQNLNGLVTHEFDEVTMTNGDICITSLAIF